MIRLLLVEDDANLCYIIRGGLEDMIGGYEIMTADNGEAGLRIWKETHPDVIVADIEMPVMDGYEMVRRIRETDDVTPILFTSGRVSPKDVVKGYELAYIIHSGFISGYQNRYGDNLKPPTNVYHRMTA